MKVLHIGKAENMARYAPQSEFAAAAERVSVQHGLAPEEYIAAMPDAHVLVADAIADVPAALIEGLPELRLIHSEGVAYNRIDRAAAAQRGVYVCNCAGMNASAVAEQTVLLMQGMLRDVLGGDRAVRRGEQIKVKEGYMARGDLKELADCKVGLVGFGDIGRSVALLLRAYGAEVFYCKRHPLTAEEEQKYGVTCLTQQELLAQCDIVSLHLPVTPSTERMCNDEFFGSMRRGSYFVNTSRGELVDDQALIRALASGQIAMAGLDTLDNEPVQADHPLVSLPPEIAGRLLFSPHIGGITASSFRRGYAMIWANIERISRGERPNNIVNGL